MYLSFSLKHLVGCVVWELAALVAGDTTVKCDEESQVKTPSSSITLSPEKRFILDAIRRQFPGKSEYFKFDSSNLDTLLKIELESRGIEPALQVSDEVFVRRTYLDLTGRLPTPKDAIFFAQNDDPDKRGKLIDDLLNTKEYAQNWARYWRDVVLYRSDVDPKKVSGNKLTKWLANEFETDRGWDIVAAQLVAADGNDINTGPDNFLLAQQRSATKMASEIARVFMGINIQCAECHDHPFDRWTRERFHEMAAFFASDNYFMPDVTDPDEKTLIKPRFLLGEPLINKPFPGIDLPLAEKRKVALAAFLIFNPKNYWFPRAFVNRVWNELLGDGFYAVDSLGPDNEAIYPLVLNRLAHAFRSYEMHPKWLFRTIMNTESYQRRSLTPNSGSSRFASLRPTKLRGDQVADVLDQVLRGKIPDSVRKTFSYDPSVPQQDLEGSIQQALLLMNNPSLQTRMSRNGPLLHELLKLESNQELVSQIYLHVLARQPTRFELTRSQSHFDSVGKRAESAEDLLWTLINSAEFLTKR